MKKIKIGRKFGILLAMILASGIIWMVEADPAVISTSTPWTTSGSSGAIDDADYSIVDLSGPYASVKAGIGTVDIRYNVVALPGLEGGNGPAMVVRYRDTGSGSRVVVKLQELNIQTGAIRNLMLFDSNNYASSRSYQARGVGSCSWNWAYNFNSNVYYIETSITRSTATNPIANPSLAGVQLGFTIC
jgi:hypothetical protein